jgi:hypothetical protein
MENNANAAKVVLSSLIISERTVTTAAAEPRAAPPRNDQLPQDRVTARVDHRFQRNSFLRLLLVTTIDRLSRTTASKSTRFEIERSAFREN